jgi:hypothetical protein
MGWTEHAVRYVNKQFWAQEKSAFFGVNPIFPDDGVLDKDENRN